MDIVPSSPNVTRVSLRGRFLGSLLLAPSQGSLNKEQALNAFHGIKVDGASRAEERDGGSGLT